MMRNVLFLIPTLGGGGAERVLVNLVNNLDRSKYKITLQTLFDVGVNRAILRDDIIYKSCFKYMFRGNAKLLTLFSPSFLYKWLVKDRYDIAISYLEGPTARIIAGCPFDDCALINWVHVELLNLKNASYSYRSVKEAQYCLSRYNHTACVADSVRADFTKLFKLNHPCSVLYNVNETEQIVFKSEEPLESIFKSGINVISVGRLVHEKGFDRLILAHKRLIEEGLYHNIYILGAGPQYDAISEQIEQSGVGNTFHLLGFDANPYKYVARADIFVCSSRREGFSTAVTEALLLGLPVVSTNCSGSYELLGYKDEYGIVTDNSTEGVYTGLRKMLVDSGLRNYYRGQAKKRSKQFQKREAVEAVEQLLDSL